MFEKRFRLNMFQNISLLFLAFAMFFVHTVCNLRVFVSSFVETFHRLNKQMGVEDYCLTHGGLGFGLNFTVLF